MTNEELLIEIERLLSLILQGKRKNVQLSAADVSEENIPLVDAFNKLVNDISEAGEFVNEIVNGNLDAPPPSRTNYVTGPLKELHSQLTSMSLNIKDLSDGKVVSKLYFPGELFDNYNQLINIVKELMKDHDESGNQSASQNVTSWSYHQVLAAVNQLKTIVIQYDEKGKLMFANLAAKSTLAAIEQLPEVEKAEPDDLLTYLGKFTNILKRMKPHEILGTRFPVNAEIHDLKTDMWYSVTTDVAHLTDDRIGVIHMIDDINEWKYIEQELRDEASLDPLTSAYTRKAGFKQFQEIIETRREVESCVGMIDLNKLKHINDNFGHTDGDFAIKTVATVMLSSVRNTDYVIRYGGDEFIILFINCSLAAAEKSISRIHDLLKDLNSSIDKPYKIGVSAGVVRIDEDMDDAELIIEAADAKMYENKQKQKSGNN